MDILARILGLEEQKLCHDEICRYIIYFFSKKNDTVLQQTGINII
jgi:hypothetical protein